LALPELTWPAQDQTAMANPLPSRPGADIRRSRVVRFPSASRAQTRRSHEASFVHAHHRLAYEVHGDGDHLVVYLHGLLLDANLNRPLATALAERGNRVVLLDLLGHGRSDKPAHASEYRMDLYVDQVFALLDELGAAEAVLGGLSLGANVSLLAAVRSPDRVRGIVLEMPVLERATPSVALTFVPLPLALHYARRPTRLLTGLIRRLPRTGFGPAGTLLNAASLDPDQMAAVLHGVLLGPVAPTFEERAAITVPALVLAHRADLIHPFSDATALTRQVPHGRLVQTRSPLELRLRPARLTAEIAAFLDDVWRPPDEGHDQAAAAEADPTSARALVKRTRAGQDRHAVRRGAPSLGSHPGASRGHRPS
jgi:pimeloyl-ACP methyl ester carboxylesterase